MQHYVIKFVSDLWHVDGFFPGTPVSSTDKTDRHDITEILLKVKVALNTMTITQMVNSWKIQKFSKNVCCLSARICLKCDSVIINSK
jgi:hypothetical protein